MDVRGELEQRIPNLSDEEWALLEDDGHVREVESGAAEVDYLVARIERVQRAVASRSTRATK